MGARACARACVRVHIHAWVRAYVLSVIYVQACQRQEICWTCLLNRLTGVEADTPRSPRYGCTLRLSGRALVFLSLRFH